MGHQLLRLSYGIMLSAILFVPFGVYHSVVEPYIVGYLWGFCLPVGYVGLLLGILMVLYPKLFFVEKVSLGWLMVFVGACLFLALIFSPKDYFINLLNSTSFSASQIDVDFPVGNLVVWAASLFSMTLGFVIRFKRPL